jgi:hypothetical protein
VNGLLEPEGQPEYYEPLEVGQRSHAAEKRGMYCGFCEQRILIGTMQEHFTKMHPGAFNDQKRPLGREEE